MWVNGQTSSFVVYFMTLPTFRTVGIVSLEGSRKWRSCRDARYFPGSMLQLLVDQRGITSVSVESRLELVPDARSRPTWGLALTTPTPSSAKVKERVKLYLSGPSWPV